MTGLQSLPTLISIPAYHGRGTLLVISPLPRVFKTERIQKCEADHANRALEEIMLLTLTIRVVRAFDNSDPILSFSLLQVPDDLLLTD
jgi:hypothetical protein